MANEWHASGADCCSPFESCLLAWCCPCIMYGRVHHRLHVEGNLASWSFFNLDCCAYYCLAHVGCNWILQMMQRKEVRTKYNLKGDGCTDCLCACCCTPCDLVQQEKECTFREGQMGQVQAQPQKVDGMYYGQQQQPQYAPQQQYAQPQYPQQGYKQ